MPMTLRLAPEEPFWITSEVLNPSLIMDKLDGLDLDGVLTFNKDDIQLTALRRVLVKFYNERGIRKQFTLKPTRNGHKIWRWQ